MIRLPHSAFFAFILTAVSSAIAQQPAQPPAPIAATRPARTPPPTRDPNPPGYVKAKELPDGTIPSPKENGNFIIGPTHPPAPETIAKEGVPQGQVFEFTMESKDSKIYPGIAREPFRPDAAGAANPGQPRPIISRPT